MATSLTLRAVKGSALTHTEVDDNFSNLKTTADAAAVAGAVGSSGVTMSSGKLLGRTTAGTGAIQEITAGSGLALSAGQLEVNFAGYLTTADAASTYQPISSMSAYLTTSTAASTYQTQAGMSSYLTTATAASTYQPISGMSSYLTTADAGTTYLTQANAASTYQTQSGMSSYLTTASAASTYQTQSGMSSYLTTSSASSTYLPLTGGTLTQVSQAIVAVAASAVDCSAGNYFTKTASGALTWTVSNVPSSKAYSFILELTNGGTGTQTWFSGIKWPGGTAPTLVASGVDVLGFITDDGGTTWRGVHMMKDSK